MTEIFLSCSEWRLLEPGLFTVGCVVSSDHKVFDVKELLCREQNSYSFRPNNIVFLRVVVTAKVTFFFLYIVSFCTMWNI